MGGASKDERRAALSTFLTERNLSKARASVPDDDAVSESFDETNPGKLKRIIVILSTPRSGSTLLCDLLRTTNVCNAHEYFQPYGYLPLLAERFGAVWEAEFDETTFLKGLVNSRTLPDGTLGINLHGHHLWVFELFSNLLDGIEVRYIRLVREDRLAQAVSFSAAKQTGKWSSKFDAFGERSYNALGIRDALAQIETQERMIDAFLERHRLEAKTVSYEQLLSDQAAILGTIAGRAVDNSGALPTLSQQRDATSLEYAERFKIDLLEPPEPTTLFDHLVNRMWALLAKLK